MAKSILRLKARSLREKGQSIKGIARQLNIAKSTISFWCRDIVLTNKQIERLMRRQNDGRLRGRLKGARMQYERRLARIHTFQESARKEIQDLTPRDLLLIGSALYWGEGSRKNRNQFIFANSDPAMIKIILRCLQNLGVSNDRIGPRICINQIHKHRIEEVTKFWTKEIKISRHQFLKPTFIKTAQRKKYKNFREHYGTLRIRVLRSSDIFYKILGVIHHLGREQTGV